MVLQNGLVKNTWKLKMRANEFIKENVSAGGTCSGSVASVAMPLGSAPIKREGITKPAKYSNSLIKRKK